MPPHFLLDEVADGPVHLGPGGQTLRVVRLELGFCLGQVLEQGDHVVADFDAKNNMAEMFENTTVTFQKRKT